MKLNLLKKYLLVFASLLLLSAYTNNVTAQKLKYCSENVFINNPDHLQLVANIGGNHHLLTFNNNENPEIFIYNNELELQAKIRMDFKFPERSSIRFIPFATFYYICIRPPLSNKYLFWKVDPNGICTDYTAYFKNLLASQSGNIKLGFQLIPYQDHLWMVYHTALDNIEKNTVVITQTDSLLNVLFSHKVMYDFKRDEEKLQKEILMFGKYLLVLKTASSGTSLELMKVYLSTGYSITNTFSSSGYFYSQSSLSINNEDSSVTVSALMTEPRATTNPKQFVFVSRLNKILVEEATFTILKSQFKKNAGTNFLLVDAQSEWMRFKISRERNNTVYNNNNNTVYQDLTMPDSNNASTIKYINRLLESTNQENYAADARDGMQGVRFSLLNKDLKIIGDSLVSNTKDSYTIIPDQFIRFKVKQKEYMLLGQQFVKKSRGLLMVNTNDAGQLIYTDVRVMDKNNHLLSKAQIIPQKGIIIPFTRKLEAGLVKITME